MDAANVGKEEHILILLYGLVVVSPPAGAGPARTWIMDTVCPDSGSQLFLSSSSIIIHQFIINTNCAFLTWYLVDYSTKTNTTGNVIN